MLLGEFFSIFCRASHRLLSRYLFGYFKANVLNIFSDALPMKYLDNFTPTLVREYCRHFVCRLSADVSPYLVKRLAVDFLDMLTDVTR